MFRTHEDRHRSVAISVHSLSHEHFYVKNLISNTPANIDDPWIVRFVRFHFGQCIGKNGGNIGIFTSSRKRYDL